MTPPATYEELAGVLDYALLTPQLTNDQVLEALAAARRYAISAVTVRPCDIDLAVRTLEGSAVRPEAVCGFPHGSATTGTKLYEGRDLLRRGARGIAMVIGISRLLSREFQHVQTELLQMAESCHKEGAALTVILESGWLTRELKIIACACCERAEVDRVALASGFGPPAEVSDLRLLREHLPEEVGLQAAAATLDEALELQEMGCARIGTSNPAAILDDWKSRLAGTATPAPGPPTARL
jgi:deoxyribose-phosphate aldolase